MDTAIVVTWTHPVAGREQQALKFAAEVAEHWGKLAADGKCTAPEVYFADTGHSMWIVRGDRKTLEAIHDSPEVTLHRMKGSLLLEGYAVEYFSTGDGADQFMTDYAKALGSLV